MQIATIEQVKDSPAIREKVMAARLCAVDRWPYFAPQLLMMVLVPTPEIETCATDCKGRFYYSPAFVENISVQALATVWLHECLHCWMDHATRRDGRAPGKWNKSVDREINDDLTMYPFPKIAPPLMPDQIGQPDGQLAEVYFAHEEDDDGEGSGGKGGDQPGGSSMDGIPREWEEGPESEGGAPEVPGSQQECVRHQVSENVVQAAKNRGNIPAGILSHARKSLAPPKVSWQREMAAAIRACAADVAGAVDFTYRRPSRRQAIHGDIIMPATRRPVPETAIVLDTSGSMYGGDLEEALNETQGVLKALGGRGVRVLATDAAVHSKQKVTHASQIQILGGGGTDMRVGLAEAAKLKPNPDLCIVLTDGYTPWPDRAPKGMTVIVALIGHSPPAAPKWARSVKVTLDTSNG